MTTETQKISSPGETIFLDEVQTVKEESERLDKEGVKIIIVLGHSGYVKDQEIAEKVPLVDVVVGGHTNTFLWNGAQPDTETVEDPYPKIVTQPSGKQVPVVQAYAYTKYLGMYRMSLGFLFLKISASSVVNIFLKKTGNQKGWVFNFVLKIDKVHRQTSML